MRTEKHSTDVKLFKCDLSGCMDGGGGNRRTNREGRYVHRELIHFVVQHCKVIYLNLKKERKKKV